MIIELVVFLFQSFLVITVKLQHLLANVFKNVSLLVIFKKTKQPVFLLKALSMKRERLDNVLQ